MADEETVVEATAAPPASSKKWILIGIAVAFLLGGGSAALFSGVFSEEEEVSAEPEEPVEEVNEIFEMQPVVINLSDASELHYLRLGLSFGLFNPNPGSPVINKEMMLPRLKDYLLTLIGEKSVSELAGPAGREALKQQILEGANGQLLTSGQGKILEVYLTDYIIQ